MSGDVVSLAHCVPRLAPKTSRRRKFYFPSEIRTPLGGPRSEFTMSFLSVRSGLIIKHVGRTSTNWELLCADFGGWLGCSGILISRCP